MKIPVPLFALLLLTAPASFAADVPSALTRIVNGQTIISSTLPAARLTIAPEIKYGGGQRFLLGSGTDAEQYFFVDAAPDGMVRRFYWIQFEHKLPGNDGTYNYQPLHTTDIGGLTFVYDSKIYTDYAGVKPAPNSDVEKARTMLAAKGLTLPRTAMRIRMFNDPGTDHRSELMVIYLEAVPPSAIPAGTANEEVMEDAYPALSAAIVRDVKNTLTIKRNEGRR